MQQVTFAVSPPPTLGVPSLPRLSDNAQGALLFAGALAACGVVIWALSWTSAPTVLDGVALLRGARSRKTRRESSSMGRPFVRESETPADRNLLRFAERMHDIPRVTIRDEIYDTVSAAVNERHARAIFRKIAPTATRDGVNAALQLLQDRVDDRMALDRIGR